MALDTALQLSTRPCNSCTGFWIWENSKAADMTALSMCRLTYCCTNTKQLVLQAL